MFIMTTVLDLLQTMNWSATLERGWTLCTVMSAPVVPPRDLNVFWHSVVFMLQTFTVPSELALKHKETYQPLYNWLQINSQFY